MQAIQLNSACQEKTQQARKQMSQGEKLVSAFQECEKELEQLHESQQNKEEEQKELEEMDREIREKQELQKQQEQENQKVQSLLDSQGQIDKQLQDLSELLRILASISEQTDKLNLLKQKFEQKAEIERKFNELKQKLEDVKMKQNKQQGYLVSLEDQNRAFKSDLSDSRYQNIEMTLLDLEIKHHMITDLSRETRERHDALEEGLMVYHHEKMKVINKTLADHWKQIYQGNDIDSIQIKSDAEKTITNARLRSYNYRIVMKKPDGSELEMRGRCSAGQKVLASICIRLTLAENFSSECSILTLDEPTTNLDQDTITSLASALVELINLKSSYENFQLVVITHDKDFIAMLGREMNSETYYNVTKNEKGYSTIEVKPLNSVL